jgi:murein L,D-transpeptidase YcbB/YkuD
MKMKHSKLGIVAFLGFALLVTGCGKKNQDQANLSGTGFDSLTTNEELAQLPQASTNTTGQQAIEVLPIETSPVTQGVSQAMTSGNMAITNAANAVSSETMSYQQKIQTALKNAGLYNGPIDGKIGPGSRKAIETFQKDNGLKVDGKVGPKTWAALEPYLTGQAGSSTASTTAVE